MERYDFVFYTPREVTQENTSISQSQSTLHSKLDISGESATVVS